MLALPTSRITLLVSALGPCLCSLGYQIMLQPWSATQGSCIPPKMIIYPIKKGNINSLVWSTVRSQKMQPDAAYCIEILHIAAYCIEIGKSGSIVHHIEAYCSTLHLDLDRQIRQQVSLKCATFTGSTQLHRAGVQRSQPQGSKGRHH